MAKVKYSEEAEPIKNKHYGFTFQPNNYGQSMFPGSKSKRFRRPRQNRRQHNNQKAVLQWRNMTPATKANWNNFAAAFQQPSKKNPLVFLSGYQTFIKRNSYCFLNHGIGSDFMLEPSLDVTLYEPTVFELKAGENTIDLTELYIANFGILPTPGQWLLFCCIPYTDNSGQFFEPIWDKLQVQEVYLDGFFLNLILPENSGNVLYSIYLSKPVSPGVSYVGTKIRYMGCFTSKKLTDLTDIPAVSPADEGKVLTVQSDGTFAWDEGGGGGGLTCEDLPACPTIISIEQSIDDIIASILESQFVSIPSVNFGLLYNAYAVLDARNIAPDGCHVPTRAEMQTIFDALAPVSVLGGYLKENSLLVWLPPNAGATNQFNFYGRGAGSITTTGAFSGLLSTLKIWTSFIPSNGYLAYYNIATNTAALNNTVQNIYKYGNSIRLVKDFTTIPEGGFGNIEGNNGRIYRTVVLGGIEIMADNLAETIFRNGDPIPKATSNAIWSSYNSAVCAAPSYNDSYI